MSTTIVFDVETGGLLDRHPTIQLAAIAIDDTTGVEIGAMECKIQFREEEADPEALRINHYDAAVWMKAAITPEEAVRKFTRFLDPYRTIQMISKAGKPYRVAKLSGYNAQTFDMPRLRRLYGDQFTPFGFHVRDVLQRVVWWFDEVDPATKPPNLKLTSVCEYFGIDTTGAHDALCDVRLCAKLARRLRSNEVPAARTEAHA